MKRTEMTKKHAGLTILFATAPMLALAMLINIPSLIAGNGSIISMAYGYSVMTIGLVTALRMTEYYFIDHGNNFRKFRLLFGFLIASGSIVIACMAARDSGPNNANKILAGVPALFPVIYSAALFITHGAYPSYRLSYALPYICLIICIVLHLPFFFIGLSAPFFNTWFPVIFVAIFGFMLLISPLVDRMETKFEDFKNAHTTPEDRQADADHARLDPLFVEYGKEFKKEVYYYCIQHNPYKNLFFVDSSIGTSVEFYTNKGKISITVVYEASSSMSGSKKKAMSIVEDAVDYAIKKLDNSPVEYTVSYSAECRRYY